MGVALEEAARNTVSQKVIQKASRDRRVILAIATFKPGFPLFETLSIAVPFLLLQVRWLGSREVAVRGKDGRLVGPTLPYCIIDIAQEPTLEGLSTYKRRQGAKCERKRQRKKDKENKSAGLEFNEM